MDKYIITYKLDGGSETVVDKSTWNDVASFIGSNKANLVEFAIERVGNPTKPTDFTDLFYDARKLEKCDMGNIDTSEVVSMSGAFSYMDSLTSLDLSNLDTSSVVSMSGAFSYMDSLTSLDLSNLDTSSVEDMSWVFENGKFSFLNLSGFDTAKVTSMAGMFVGTSQLTSLDLSSFDTSNVKMMNFMFNGCSGLTELDLASFDTSKVENTWTMFRSCSNLKTIYVSDLWDNSSNSNSGLMFDLCTSLVGAVPYNPSKVDATMANYTTGYFTKKPEPLPPYRYWVGGSGNWNDTSHWSASSGGPGGAYVPTSDDDVFIDNNSGFNSGGTITAPLGVCKGLVLSPGIAIDLGSSQIGLASLQAIGTSDNLISITGGTLSKSSGFVQCDYLALEESTTTGGAKWYAGEHSIDNGGNVGWLFRKRKYPLPVRPWKA